VNRRNHPPTLAPLPHRTLVAGQTLVVTNAAADQDVPAPLLSFALLSGPEGASLDPVSGVLTWRPTMAQASNNHTFTLSVADTGSVAVLPPVADATVKQEAASENFGFEPLLAVANEIGTTPQRSESFLRFDVSQVGGAITQARLLLMPLSTENPSVQAVYGVVDDTWLENTLTADIAPTASSLIGTRTPSTGVPVELWATAVVLEAANTDGLSSFRILAAEPRSTNSTSYASRECGTPDFPQLHLALVPLAAVQTFTVDVQLPRAPTFGTPAFADGELHLEVAGDAGPDYTVLVSSNLITWNSLLVTNPAALPFQLVIPPPSGQPQQFYRVLLGP